MRPMETDHVYFERTDAGYCIRCHDGKDASYSMEEHPTCWPCQRELRLIEDSKEAKEIRDELSTTGLLPPSEEPILKCATGLCPFLGCINYWRDKPLCQLCNEPAGGTHLLPDAIVLRYGGVVTDADGRSRGLVIWTPAMAAAGLHQPHVPLLSKWDYVIEQSAGCSSVTSNVDARWTMVPESEWTCAERIESVRITWRPCEWWNEDDGEPPEDLSYGYALLAAILPPAKLEELEVYGECRTLGELAYEVGRYLDEAGLGAASLRKELA